MKSWQKFLIPCKDLLGNCFWLYNGQKLLFRTEMGPSAERPWRRVQAVLLAAVNIRCYMKMELPEEFVGMKEKFTSD